MHYDQCDCHVDNRLQCCTKSLRCMFASFWYMTPFETVHMKALKTV